jgi:hypothetical protein
MPNNPIDRNVLVRLIGAHGRFSPGAKVTIDGPRIGWTVWNVKSLQSCLQRRYNTAF